MKNVDTDEPTSFLDHVSLGCTQRECKPHETIIEQGTKMFESRIVAGATEKLPGWQKPNAQTVDRTPTHKYTSMQYSLFAPRAWLKSSRIAFHLCAPEKNLSSGVAHVSPFVVASVAVHHEHFIFLIHSSFYHDTRTRSTTGTT